MAKPAEQPKAKQDDPLNLHARTEAVYDWLLKDWEDNPDLKNRNDAIKLIQYGGMFLTRNLKLQEAADESNAGSAVKRYSGAFRTTKTTDAARGRKAGSGPAKQPVLAYVAGADDDDGDDAA